MLHYTLSQSHCWSCVAGGTVGFFCHKSAFIIAIPIPVFPSQFVLGFFSSVHTVNVTYPTSYFLNHFLSRRSASNQVKQKRTELSYSWRRSRYISSFPYLQNSEMSLEYLQNSHFFFFLKIVKHDKLDFC